MVKSTGNTASFFDRAEELKRFDSSKSGVKGLVDSGVTEIPPIFLYPKEALETLRIPSDTKHNTTRRVVPVVDLSGPRKEAVEALSRAARDPGIFQIVGHGIPLETMARAREGVRSFHELPAETRAMYYGSKGSSSGQKSKSAAGFVTYRSNFDLHVAKVASWHDTIRISMAPDRAPREEVPEVLRGSVEEWDKAVLGFGDTLVGMLGEGLGLCEDRLRGLTIGHRRLFVGHYYPFCPQPDRTMGLAPHADPSLLTVLLQDHVGGLQFKSVDGVWVDVSPIPGALVINVGDLFQILSNNTYKSVEHRVLANSCHGPRVSVVVFLNPSNRSGLFGPLPELISPQKPAVYRQMTYEEFIIKFVTKELDGPSLKNFFKI